MAHAAKLHELVAGLINSITAHDVTTAQRNHVAKHLREHNFARTNQFAVKAKIDGLIEKFDVLGRDDLAVALQASVDRLPSEDKFLPDKLALLLELSYFPHRKVDTQTIRALGQDARSPEPEATWAKILQDHPPDEDIWGDIQRGYHSSGDEAGLSDDGRSGDTSATTATSVQEDLESLARHHLQPIPTETITKPMVDFTELKLARESLFMLRGLSADTYAVDHRTGKVYSSALAALHKTSRQTTRSLTDTVAAVGSSVNYLRGWCRASLTEPHLRACQATIQALLQDFDGFISTQECQLLSSGKEAVVSMLSICAEVERRAHALTVVAATIKESSKETLLDSLHGAACNSHAIGDRTALDATHSILLATLRIFLRPIVQWSHLGEIAGHARIPLVAELLEHCPLSRIWHDRYAMRADDALPAFLRGFSEELFNMGKTQMMIKLLDPVAEITSRHPEVGDIQMSDLNTFEPFDQQFHRCLQNYIKTIRSSSKVSLVDLLRRHHGMGQYFDNLEALYLIKDADVFSQFSDYIFRHLYTTGHHMWLSDFVLSEFAREAVLQSTRVYQGVIDISISAEGMHATSIRKLEHIRLNWSLPWYIANIVRSESSEIHRRVFSRLLQLAYVKRMLQTAIPAWRTHRSGRLSADIASLYCLNQSLIAFVDTLTSHTTMVGMELSRELKIKLQVSTTFDEIIAAYGLFAEQLALLTLTATSQDRLREDIVGALEIADGVVSARKLILGVDQAGQAHRSLNNTWRLLRTRLESIVCLIRQDYEEIGALEVLAEAIAACLPKTMRSTNSSVIAHSTPGREHISDCKL